MISPPTSPHVLVVCTANVCRSPVVERLLPRHLAAVGIAVGASSAGTHGGRNVVHPDTAAVALEVGIDLSDHWSRRLTRRLLAAEGGDLIVALTREHVYQLIAIDESTWARTFTLPELARRARAAATAGTSAASFAEWVSALSAGRTSSDLLPGSDADDVADPYGRSRRHHRSMVKRVDELCRVVAVGAATTMRTPSVGGL